MNTSNSNVVHAFKIADAAKEVRHVFIRDLVLTCFIGVHKHERKKPQRIRVNIDLAVTERSVVSTDRLADVVCYEDVADRIRSIVNNGHVNLVETLAEKIASKCLEDRRIKATRVRIEKLDVFKDAVSAGVEIERFSSLESI